MADPVIDFFSLHLASQWFNLRSDDGKLLTMTVDEEGNTILTADGNIFFLFHSSFEQEISVLNFLRNFDGILDIIDHY